MAIGSCKSTRPGDGNGFVLRKLYYYAYRNAGIATAGSDLYKRTQLARIGGSGKFEARISKCETSPKFE